VGFGISDNRLGGALLENTHGFVLEGVCKLDEVEAVTYERD
jgi:hypothetical protein